MSNEKEFGTDGFTIHPGPGTDLPWFELALDEMVTGGQIVFPNYRAMERFQFDLREVFRKHFGPDYQVDTIEYDTEHEY